MAWRLARRRAERTAAADPVAAYDELRAGFTAVVSHELRTPLARLLALLDSAELPDADVPALLEQARAEVVHAVEAIDEVLFLSDLESHPDAIGGGSTEVAPVAAEVLSELRERAELADVELRADVESEVRLPLRRRLVRMLVANLADNAVRHAGPGAVFTLHARREDGRVLLIAEDTGAGVATADLGRVFERFFRADRARTTPGTGLGLAIVKHVVVAAGGEVDATGGPGRGLRVTCRFPAPA